MDVWYCGVYFWINFYWRLSVNSKNPPHVFSSIKHPRSNYPVIAPTLI